MYILLDFAIAITYDDYSGLSEDDTQSIDSFLKDKGHLSFNFEFEEAFEICAVSNKVGTCVEINDTQIKYVYQVKFSDKTFDTLEKAVKYVAEINKLGYTTEWDKSKCTPEEKEHIRWTTATTHLSAWHKDDKTICFYNVNQDIKLIKLN